MVGALLPMPSTAEALDGGARPGTPEQCLPEAGLHLLQEIAVEFERFLEADGRIRVAAGEVVSLAEGVVFALQNGLKTATEFCHQLRALGDHLFEYFYFRFTIEELVTGRVVAMDSVMV